MIDRLLGGPGQGAVRLRELTDIELQLSRNATAVLLRDLSATWSELADLSFTIDRAELTTATDTLAALGDVSEGIRTDDQIGKVSIIGAGMRSHPGVAAKVFEVLGREEINIEMISTSPIKISCVISAGQVPAAVRALHQAFELGADAVRAEDPEGAEHRPTVGT